MKEDLTSSDVTWGGVCRKKRVGMGWGGQIFERMWGGGEERWKKKEKKKEEEKKKKKKRKKKRKKKKKKEFPVFIF